MPRIVEAGIALVLLLFVAALTYAQEATEKPLLVFRSAFEDIYALNPDSSEPFFGYSLQSKGFARADYAGGLAPMYGSFTAPNAGRLLRAKPDAGDVRVVLIRCRPGNSNGRILSWGKALKIHQRDSALVVNISGNSMSLPLGKDPDQTITLRLAISNSYADLEVDNAASAKKAFSSWPADQTDDLVFGDGDFERPGWGGRISFIAIYDTAESRVDQLPAFAKPTHKSTHEKSDLHLRGQLLKKSAVATPESIQPYFQSVTVYEYEVLDVVTGRYFPDRIRVAHWTMLDGTLLPIESAKPGVEIDLICRPFADCRNVATVHLSDTLEASTDLQLFFDISDAALTVDNEQD